MNVCVVCKSPQDGFRPYWRILKRCETCGHVMADIDLNTFDPRGLYRESYFSGDEYDNYLRDRRVFEKQFMHRLGLLARFQPTGTLIEIGCAYGIFLSLAMQRYAATGFDIVPESIDYARNTLGVDARCEDFLQASVRPASTDIVVMWDTIEHLARPDLTVDKVARVLRPGGYCALTTGDIGSIMARVRKDRWRLIHPPTHLHYFSRHTISRLLSNAGLTPVQCTYVGVRRSVRQIAYSLFGMQRHGASRIYRALSTSRAGDLSFALNTYDIFFVVGQKSR